MHSAEVFFEFVEAVAALPSLRGDSGKSQVTQLLRPDIAGAIRHDRRTRIYALNLVRACLDRERGIGELLDTLRILEGDSRAMTRVATLAVALPGPGTRDGRTPGDQRR